MSNTVLDFYKLQEKAFFESDYWDLTTYPDDTVAEFFSRKQIRNRIIDFTNIHSDNKKSELKTFYKAVLQGNASIPYTSPCFPHLFPLTVLANKFENNSFLDLDDEGLRILYSDVIEELHFSSEAVKHIPTFTYDLYDLTDTRIGFERDIWHLDKLNISQERFNAANPPKTFNFRNVINLGNREYLKIWGAYLIGCTELAMSSIMNSIVNTTTFLNEFDEISASDITSDDISTLVDDWTGTRTNAHINKILKNANDFYAYWEVREESRIKSPILPKHYLQDDYVPSDNLISENVVIQIFKKLHTLPLQERTMFLINYCAGLRISDICQLKTDDCLYYDDNDGYFLTYSCQKMQKAQMNLIPKSLYIMIQEQQTYVRGKSKYLFPGVQNIHRPMRSGCYVKNINRWVSDCGIKNDDGTPYHYKTHTYRHSLATDLLQNYGVDLQVIQLAVLNHQEIQMTLTYAQRGDKFNKCLHDKYINNYGNYESLDLKDTDGLQRKALGNGFCNLPDRIGTCPYSDVCLNCEFFRTSKSFLDMHKKHLEEVRKNIILFESNGWIVNLNTAKETEKTLIKIIDTLEKIDE